MSERPAAPPSAFGSALLASIGGGAEKAPARGRKNPPQPEPPALGGAESAGASEPPVQPLTTRPSSAKRPLTEPDAPAVVPEREPELDPARAAELSEPTVREVRAPGRARAMTAEECAVWMGPIRAKGEAAKLTALLVRWRADPVCAAIELFRVVPKPYQAAILLDLFDAPAEVYAFYGIDPNKPKRQVVAPSGHGLGKTRILAIAIWLMLTLYRFCKVLITAPTADQITGQLFGELRKLHRRMHRAWPVLADEWEILGSSIRHKNPEYADWCAVARTARADAPEGLQGAHAKDADDEFGDVARLFGDHIDSAPSGGIFIGVEEASGVPDEIYEVLEGALSEAGARMLQIGNATRADGRFAANVQNAKRYAIHPLDCRMSNQDIVYELPYRDLQGRLHNLRGRGLVEPRYWETILSECGGDEEHDRFRVRVRGLVPRSNFDQVIRGAWVEAAMKRPPDPSGAKLRAVVGLDFGLTGDKHGLAVRRGWSAFAFDEWLPPDRPEDITMEAARRAMDAIATYNGGCIVGDSNGVGRGAMEFLANYYHVEHPELGVRVIFFNAGAGSGVKRYARKRDKMWHQAGRAWLSDPRCSLEPHPRLAKQLTGPGAHEDDAKRIHVESKADVEKRTGEKSGNVADALLQTLVADDEALPPVETPSSEAETLIPKPLAEHFARLRRGQESRSAIR